MRTTSSNSFTYNKVEQGPCQEARHEGSASKDADSFFYEVRYLLSEGSALSRLTAYALTLFGGEVSSIE